MRVLTFSLALAVLVARPAGAGRMLYATAASDNRIDGFCLRDDGGFKDDTPRWSIPTRGEQPRRLIVFDGVLYVVEVDRVESYTIEGNGNLRRIGSTPVRPRSSPHDAVISPNGTMLYVPDRSESRVVGHPLPLPPASDAETRPPPQDFTTCVQGEIGDGLQSVAATSDRLYISASGGSGRIAVFGIDANGALLGAADADHPDPSQPLGPDDCAPSKVVKDPDRPNHTTNQPRSKASTPLSERRRIADVKSFVLVGDLLYAEDRGRRRIRGFRLHDGNFEPATCTSKTTKQPVPCTDENKPYKKRWQKPVSKTKRIAHYQMILHYNGALLGTQFFRGRIDSYALARCVPCDDPVQPSDCDDLKSCPTGPLSDDDLRLTPVRLTADQDVVYVAAGEYDRIIAYRLRPDGVLKDKEPFSKTKEQKGSFPNDVAVAMLTAGCGR